MNGSSFCETEKSMKIWKIMLVIVVLMSLCSCGSGKKMPIEVVSDAVAGCALPAGVIYDSHVGSDSEGYLSEHLLKTLFGECGENMKQVESCAIYMTAKQDVCEAAVFRCYSSAGTGEIVEMCLYRSGILERYAPDTKTGITVCGRYVFWAAGKNADGIISALKRAARSG